MFTSNISHRLLAAGIPGHLIDVVMEDLLRRLLELEQLKYEDRARNQALMERLNSCLGGNFTDTLDAGSRERTAAASALCYQPTAVRPTFGADIPRGANVGFVSGAAISAKANTEAILERAKELAQRGDEKFIEKLGAAHQANERAIKVGGGVPNFDSRVAAIVAAACASESAPASAAVSD